MRPHAFGDESCSRKYLLVAVLVEPRDLESLRGTARGFRYPNQRRIHFCNEKNRRRKEILCGLKGMPGSVVVIDATAASRQRDAALECLVDYLAKAGAQRLVIERDDSIMNSDKKVIRDRSVVAGCAETLSYEFMRAHEEPLLAIPDAIAWCVQKGGDWAKRVRPLIAETIVL